MFFSSKVKTNDIVEILRKADPLKERANVLQTVCEEFDFCLDGSFNSAEDATFSLKQYLRDRPSEIVHHSLIQCFHIDLNLIQ